MVKLKVELAAAPAPTQAPVMAWKSFRTKDIRVQRRRLKNLNYSRISYTLTMKKSSKEDHTFFVSLEFALSPSANITGRVLR